jgi:hypothetical protein
MWEGRKGGGGVGSGLAARVRAGAVRTLVWIAFSACVAMAADRKVR